MKNNMFIALAGLIIISACVFMPANKNTEPVMSTIAVVTEQAKTIVSPPTLQPTTVLFRGIPVTFNNITFTIPLELNASTAPTTGTDVEFPYINPSGGPMAEHAVFDLTNFPVEGAPRITIFKSSDYAAYGPPSQSIISALLGRQDDFQPLPKALAQDFYAQSKTVSFVNGHGVRFISQVMGNFAPITNGSLFYCYQGITDDGAYFVSAVFPINSDLLAADGKINSPVPANGIPFPADPSAPGVFSTYLDKIAQNLNGTSPENFKPSLTLLDKLIEFIQVQ